MPQPTPLQYPFQRKGSEWLSERRTGFLADGLGVGKTIQAIGACDIVGAMRILVVAPGVSRWNWCREFERFQTVPRLTAPIMGTKMMPNADVIVVSYSLIRRLPVLRWLLMQQWDVVILDEVHNAKNPNATQTRALYGAKCDSKNGIVSKAKRVWILSGTPAPNNLGELFSHCNALFKDVAPDCPTYNRFVDKYCIKRPMSDSIIGANKETQPQLIASLRPYVLRRLAKDVLAELPSLRVNQISVRPDKLPPRPEEIAEIEMVLAAALAKAEADKSDDALQALKAVSETHLTTLRRWTGIALAPSVIQQIKDDIESGLSAFVVFGVHHAVIEMFLEQLPNTVGLYGKTKEGNDPGCRDYAIDSFQGRIPGVKPQGIICAFDVASTAITLTEASRIYMPETPWVPSHIEQAIGRVHRNGQKNPVIADIFSLEGSVHTQVIRTIMRKIKMLSVFNEGIQGGA
jgi:SWI/SNF-related matrix-associated actin-dependent regulator 1 of chromatin subfamily A